MSHLYIVDDDTLTCELLSIVAEPLFKGITVFNDAGNFLAHKINDNDVVLLDLMMPGVDGIEVLRNLAGKKSTARVVLISGYDQSVLHSAERLAYDYGLKLEGQFTKPISIDALTELLAAILSKICRENIENINTMATNTLFSKVVSFLPNKDDLLSGIKNKEFILHYQPQINMKSGELSGVEALVRWQHPVHGLIFPDSFIQLFESTGVIGLLTEVVTNLAVVQIEQWRAQGAEIKVSVNISAQNITTLNLPEQLNELMARHKILPSMLVLEVTESALMGNLTLSLDILTRLRLKGINLSIDDFGTGFSSLSQLHKIPFTELKIDQSFVTNMDRNSDSFAIVETCIMLGHKLNMEVVAEGIEDKAIWDLLVEMDCDVAQGYYIAKPMPANELINWNNNRINNLDV
ncbi:MAG: EAL domain-containing protein (putative c-di-GMP-specific phosphodiesterase class I) [Alteromonadaceae bacterium]|jgi:EAL domain-containing protein (putative c-di-GMP-specific phosphodiesterase class I)/CheY-like chemotaxis protein